MKIFKKIYIATLLLSAVMLASCQKEAGTYIYPEYTSWAFGYKADSVEILVESNAEWTVDADSEWLTASKSVSSEGVTLLTVRVLENADLEQRIGTVTISAGTVNAELAIRQNGASFSGIFENLGEFPVTCGCVASQNVKYLLGVKYAEADSYSVATIINAETGERRDLDASKDYDYAVAISDEGDDYILHSRSNGTYIVCLDGSIVDLQIPEGYKNTGYYLGAISGDGRVITGALNSTQNGTGRFPCKWVDGVCEILERPSKSSHGTETAPYGTLARDCSGDGSVIYGTEWSLSSYALCFWRDGEMFYPGGDYAEMHGAMADRICKTAEFGGLSVNGKYLAARYETTSHEGFPVIIDTETYDVKILKEFSDMSGSTCSDDGLLFAVSPIIGATDGYVIDPEAGTCMTTSEYLKNEFNLQLSSGKMVSKVSDNGKRFFGTMAHFGQGGMFQVDFWYLNMEPSEE